MSRSAKPLVTLLTILLLATTCMAVEVGDRVTVFLQNGGMVKGEVIEFVDGDHVVVQPSIGPPKTIRQVMIAKIVVESESSVEKSEAANPSASVPSDSLAFVFTYLHLLAHYRSGDPRSAYGLSGTVGFLTNRNFSIGPGIGIDFHREGSLLPVYSEVVLYFSKDRVTPYLYGHAGYALGWWHHQHGSNFGGLRTGIGFGVQSRTSRTTFLTAQIGVEIQSMSTEYRDIESYPNWLSLAVGIKL